MWLAFICICWFAVIVFCIYKMRNLTPSIEGTPGNGEIAILYYPSNFYRNYQVYYKKQGEDDTLLRRVDIVTSSNVESRGIISQLSNGEVYEIYLKARPIWSISKRRLAYIEVTPQLTPPRNLQVTPGQESGTIVLSWSPVSNATGYEIYRGLELYTTTAYRTIATIQDSKTTGYIDKSGLVNGQKYQYRILAMDGRSRSALSPFISVVLQLETPTIFLATADKESSGITLSWSAVDDATGYEIERASGIDVFTAFTSIATIQNGKTTTYIDKSNLEDGKTYNYRVLAIENLSLSETLVKRTLAYCGLVRSLPSSIASVTLPLTSPNNVNAVAGNESASIKLSWSSVTNATSYEIQRSFNSSDWTSFSMIEDILSDQTTTYVDNAGLVNGETCYYRIVAINSRSRSAFSSIVSATPELRPPSHFQAAGGQESAAIALSWSPVPNAIGYKIDRGSTVNSTTNFTTIADISNGQTTIFIDKSGVVNGESYHYRIAAVDSRSTSAYSSIISATAELTAPTNFKAVLSQDCTTVLLSWSTVPDATGYKIQRASDIDNMKTFSTITNIQNGEMTTYIDKSGLKNEITYGYRIAAIDDRSKKTSWVWAMLNRTVLKSPFSSVVLVTITFDRCASSKTISVRKGDLTAESVDAIVVSSSSDILRKAILKAAGPAVETEYTTAANKDSLASDNVIVTSPGHLLCKKIFFLSWESNSYSSTSQQSLTDFVRKAIQRAIKDKLNSIAFPAVGCGQYGCSIDLISETMVSEAINQLQISNSSMEVVFVLQPDRQDLYDKFMEQKKKFDETIKEVSLTNRSLLSRWERSKDANQIRVPVSAGSTEYKSIVNQFMATIKPCSPTIVRLERIQNERWYKQYKAHEEDFTKRLKRNTVKTLYHGCPEQSANTIIKDGFNRSYAGVNGTVYGFGVYFATDANYSHSYARPNSAGEQHMFVVKVLIGNSTPGNSSMKVCPLGYDSTTNGSNIYVAYHDAQSYAEYLIIYKT